MRVASLLSLILLLFFFQDISAQSKDKYRITFRDKANNKYSLEKPDEFLSQRSLERRSRQKIEINESDLPVSDFYLDSLSKLGIEVINFSKWFNSALVKSSQNNFPDIINNLDFIIDKEKVFSSSVQKSAIQKFNSEIIAVESPVISNYGYAKEQISLSNGQFLHNKGYKGKGMLIAVIDAGFYKANELPAFVPLWDNSSILGTRNFVDDNVNVFNAHPHGMYVLSIIGGNIPGTLVGTAPESSFWLIRSEDTSSEFLIEEDNWIAAAELADSVGADVINSSLGYYEFDDPSMNHTYTDMDGKTTRVTQGAEIASSKGIFVSVSAGNEGNDNWHYIIAPSDAPNVLSIGAVDSLDQKAYFSSFGPSADGRVKPDVTAMGRADAFQGTSGAIVRGNGTSFSSPVIAGLATCLWQAFPNISSLELNEAIRKSGRNYHNPNDGIGYGTADFLMAYYYLQSQNISETGNELTIFPNPVLDYVRIIIPQTIETTIDINILNSTGQLIKQVKVQGSGSNFEIIRISELDNLIQGTYLIKIYAGNTIYSGKIIKL